MWPYVLLIVFLLFATPLSLGVRVWYARGQMRLLIAFKAWGLGGSVTLMPFHDAAGRLMLRAERQTEKPARDQDPQGLLRLARMLVSAVIRGNRARHVLFRALRVRAALLGVRVSGADAARVARFTGLLRSVPSTNVFRVVAKPDFRQKGFACQFLCIVDARLGMLLTGSVMAAMSYLVSRLKQNKRGIRRRQTWTSIPSAP